MLSMFLLCMAATITITLGIIVFFQQNRQPMNVNFALLSFSIAGWIISNALFASVDTESTRFTIGLVSYGFAAFLALTFFLFCLDIAEKEHRTMRLAAKLVGIPTIILSMAPGIVAYGVDGLSMKTNIVGLLAYAIVLILLFGGGLWSLLQASKSSHSQIDKDRNTIVLLGLFIAVLVGIVCNLILPLFDNYSLVQYGPLGSVALVAVCTYSIIRYGLF